MIRKKTVFVVGAGASYELGFPLGEDLLNNIASSVDFKIAYNDVTGGSQEFWSIIRRCCHASGGKINEYLEAALRLRDASHLALSIDNVVHQQYTDHILVKIAKMAITYQLLLAEDKTALRIHENSYTKTWPKTRGTWLGRFSQLVTQDISKENADIIFDNVSVISFNYDRSIRRFLPFAIQSQFALPDGVAHQIAKKLKIFHPYGSLGAFSWEDTQKSVAYGQTRHEDISEISSNIRTFTEQMADNEALEGMRSAISDAEQVIFLGFGFLNQNMEIITNQINGSARSIMGTAYKISEPDIEIIGNSLNIIFKDYFRSHKSAYLRPIKCEEFLRENFRSITSPSTTH